MKDRKSLFFKVVFYLFLFSEPAFFRTHFRKKTAWSCQKRGIGSKILKLILKKYESVRQIILLTDDTEKTVNYYKKNGLVKASDSNAVAFMK